MREPFHRSFRSVAVATSLVAILIIGCASRRSAAERVRVGMTPDEVEEVMKGSGRERSTVKEGERTIVLYQRTGDYFVFKDGRLERHYRHGESQPEE